MARVDADRNLLLGILAQQMDFVPRDALFEAMNAWIIRKETPLGALLVERGDLAKSRRELLEALVEEHIRAHGGDPARSLQALSSVGPVADDLGRLPDSDVRASVGHLRIPETVPPPGQPMETRVPESLGQPTSWNGRFRVVRPHASGGLGVVSVALDDELDREIALKEIKDDRADDRGSRARFVLEAEITGKLEHPGIIPIYGLGHDPTGRPFYAMRFIRGDSLSDAIDRYHDPSGPYYFDPAKRSLQLRELLGRFLDVCDAMSYAHSRGVLHRDLKPGNVMLGPFGETLVVDWGLALPLERVPEGHESTHGAVRPTRADSAALPREQGEVIGTPAYMSPEQAEGAIDRLGPRSDVYGLGAILYELLTGKRPVEGTSLEQILHAVNHGEIKPPRQVRPEITKGLEAVCLKALALRPEDRYPTPRALASDIKAWLAAEPVSARPESFIERASRWAKRNRREIYLFAFPLILANFSQWIFWDERTRARNELVRKNTDLAVAYTDLLNKLHRAEQREVQAETRAIEAVKKLAEMRDSDPAMVALDVRLSVILRGYQQPKDSGERLQLAQRSYDKALHAAAAKLWADAIDADPKLAEDRQAQTRYNAARAAALAGCGLGKDDPAPDDAAKAKLRRQALDWLKAELAAWGKLLESGPPQARPAIVQTLDHWKQDGDLAGIRDAEALARLPEAERTEWRALWSEVETLLKRAQ
jgi:serine/threonine protein kinase